jgi:hypothetical protein
MKHCFWGLMFTLSFGCGGRNTVADGDKTKAEQLEETVPAWCQRTCERLSACGVVEGTGVSQNCAADCEEEMRRFTAGDDECATIGKTFESCIDGASCEQVLGKDFCRIPAPDSERCPSADGGDPGAGDVPPSSGTGGAPSDTGGTSGPIAGTTASGGAEGGSTSGGASSAGAAGAGSGGSPGTPAVSCMAAYGAAGSSPADTASSVTCEEGRAGCSDGRAYDWICVRGSQGQTGCTCFVDSQVTGGFDPASASCPTVATVNAGCGWAIDS